MILIRAVTSSQTMGLSPQASMKERIDENHSWVTDDGAVTATLLSCLLIVIDSRPIDGRYYISSFF